MKMVNLRSPFGGFYHANHMPPRVELKPETGRTHQLRVHMQALGHTILGDRFYGNDVQIAAEPRLQLHAQQLSLRHPNGGAWHEFKCDVSF